MESMNVEDADDFVFVMGTVQFIAKLPSLRMAGSWGPKADCVSLMPWGLP